MIPDTATEKLDKGVVLAVGNGRIRMGENVASPDVKLGDRVLSGKYVGADIKLAGVKFLVMY